MTRQEHDEYVRRVKEFQAKVDRSTLDDLELTDEEQAALDDFPEQYKALYAELSGQYAPAHPEWDNREAIANKAMAVFALEIMPIVEQAYRYGVETEL
jgi:hypothetical protein